MTIWIPDSSSLIDCKRRIAVADQWATFGLMEQMVLAGEIALPRQVVTEVSGGRWPDAPGAWASGMRPKLVHPLDCPPLVLREVLALTPRVIERDASEDAADPYVLALALHLNATTPFTPRIVTEDIVDRLPLKMAMTTAADAHGIEHCGLFEFMTEIGVRCRPRIENEPD